MAAEVYLLSISLERHRRIVPIRHASVALSDGYEVSNPLRQSLDATETARDQPHDGILQRDKSG